MISEPARIKMEKLTIRPRTIDKARRQDDGDRVVAPAMSTTGRTGSTHGEMPAIMPATMEIKIKNMRRLSLALVSLGLPCATQSSSAEAPRP